MIADDDLTAEQLFSDLVARHRPLPPAEQGELALAAQAGDTAARDKLVLHSLRLVCKVAQKHCKRDKRASFLDLVQAGTMGLMRAIDRWNPEHEPRTTLSTYAMWWIVQGVMREGSSDTTIQTPEWLRNIQRKARKGRATADELARLARAGLCGGDTLSLSVPVGQHGDVLEDRLPDPSPQPDALAIAAQEAAQLHTAIAALPENERFALAARFGFEPHRREHTLEEITHLPGWRWGQSRERARQLVASGVRRLRRRMGE